MALKKHKIFLRGYIIQKHTEYFGICLTLNLFVYGKSPEETEKKLKKLIKWYVEDVIKHNEIKEMIPRRAPFKFYLKYFSFRFFYHTLFVIYKSIRYFESYQKYYSVKYA